MVIAGPNFSKLRHSKFASRRSSDRNESGNLNETASRSRLLFKSRLLSHEIMNSMYNEYLILHFWSFTGLWFYPAVLLEIIIYEKRAWVVFDIKFHLLNCTVSMISNLYSNLYEQYRERNNGAIFFLFLFKWRDNEKSVKSRIIIISDILYVYMYGTNFLKRKKKYFPSVKRIKQRFIRYVARIPRYRDPNHNLLLTTSRSWILHIVFVRIDGKHSPSDP